jgi:hypothetical protein
MKESLKMRLSKVGEKAIEQREKTFKNLTNNFDSLLIFFFDDGEKNIQPDNVKVIMICW